MGGAAGAEGPAPAAEEDEEKRVDPDDGQVCTLQELREKYAGVYGREEIEEYWEAECQLAEPEEKTPPDDVVNVDGTEMKSLPARNRRKPVDRFGREREAGY